MSMPSTTELSRSARQQDQIRHALHSGELRTHYQPIVDLTTGRVLTVEALLRWQHPMAGLLQPEDFLPAITHRPIADDITRWVLHSSLSALQAWPGCSVSLNVTARDITRPGFVGDVVRSLTRSGTAPERLTLELTEQAVMQDFDAAVAVLELLRGVGVGLALDNFGTGFSSLLYLRDLPVTEVKIDRAFVSGLSTRADDVTIVRSVAKLARSIGLRVVAVGVETHEQAAVARAVGCHAGQGFLWGEPSEAGEIDPDQTKPVPAAAPASARHRGRIVHSSSVERRMGELAEEGASLHTIAAALNTEGVRTPWNTRWTAFAVARALDETS